MKTRKRKNVWFKIVLAIAVVFILLAIIAPIFAPHDPLKTDFARILEAPSLEYPLGTDQVGRCILSRILYGASVSLGMTSLLLSIVTILGVTIGVISGLFGGIVDTIIMRITDTVLSFPDIVFAIAIVGVLGPGMKNTIIAFSIVWWTKYARLTRVLVWEVKNNEYIQAAKMAGAGKMKLVTHYIFPNISSSFIVQFVIDIGGIMLALAGLSFLGLGVQTPTPEWGNMLNEGRAYLQTAPWLLIFPGIAIFTVVAIFNTLGDLARDVLDPKHT
ncbi:nickel transporter permease [Sporosarcina sp. FSL W7-1349]|uniref:nickel transporter permease n=1 Tax=Sporosarcina sp. FSL W7-1349 TaxID=2921561 RepID=UPI0030F6C447